MKDRRVTKHDRQLEHSTIELQQAARAIFLGTPQGTRVLDHILDTFCGVDAPQGAGNAEQLNYRAGARDVGVRLKELVYGDLKKKIGESK